MAYTPDARGRGAWTRTGGLLPGKPGQTGTFGYYRLAVTGEPAVGSTWDRKADTSDAAHAVNSGVAALQALLEMPAADRDGWWGPRTDAQCRLRQTELRLTVDGVAGPATLRALLVPVVKRASDTTGIPFAYLGGLLQVESALDPGCVGVTTPNDHGLVQVNLAAFGPDSGEEVTYEQAMDPAFVIPWAARRIRAVYDRWVGKTAGGIDPYEVALLSHNSPANALKLARSGKYPSAQSQSYVQAVMTAWT